ncbi:uncharacterized protein LOC125229159 [Leguminivora glycinivorella]|uniref:uncharacterized protein LOC125229159 n=1 Tax=Leguminivora glycinivorella TaxID=1035111 RepID=UPI00200CDF95|nr:uncharacterized protein LOC125229159 [Leguminivora glycinivorella]XP_047989904.1 uncharacterized protein LOC125229159 [Leguminivora glycinivorella]
MHHSLEASCILGPNDVCAQYTYYFNDIAENSTYMCTRAVDQLGNSINRGCYESTNGSSTTRVCFCRSLPGGVPCNSSISTVVSVFTIVLALALVFDRRVLPMI